MAGFASCLIDDAFQVGLLEASEHPLIELKFHTNVTQVLDDILRNRHSVLAVVPCSALNRVVSEFPDIPVIAHGPARLLHEAFACGVCDYLKEPWDAAEFTARVLRHVDRSFYQLSWADIRADGHSSYLNGRPLDIKPGAHRLLGFLLRSCGKVVQRKHLLHAIGMMNPRSRLVDVYVAELRKAITTLLGHGSEQRILSHQGFGYSISP